MELDRLISELHGVVGPDNVCPGDERIARALVPAAWGRWPICIVRPGSADEVPAVVNAAESAGVAVIPCGSGSRLYTGSGPSMEKSYLVVQMSRMNRVLDYQPDDMTVTCEAGVTLEALQQALAERRQFLPLDTPIPERTTIAGIVSTNSAGFSRPSYGSPRDLLIGLKAVMTGGVVVKGGGKVVKNVAGYDVCKLFTGAWGTLGVLTELTFKVRPISEAEMVLSWQTDDVASAARLGLELFHSEFSPAYVLATNEPEGVPALVVGLQGVAVRVLWQQQQAMQRVRELGLESPATVLGEMETAYLRDVQARLHRDVHLSARIACLPTEVPALVRNLELLSGLQITAQCAVGAINVAACTSDAALTLSLRSALPASANLVWTRIDPEIAGPGKVAPWGPPRQEFALQKALKQSLDPQRTFSPGRFVGSL